MYSLFLKIKNTLVFMALCVLTANAHVALNQPAGGEVFAADSAIFIEWTNLIDHGDSDWDIFFSADDGNSWEPIATDLLKSTLSYNWDIPENTLTDQAKIKIVQDNLTGLDYEASSATFSILDVSGIPDLNNSISAFILYPAYPNPFNGRTVLSFELNSQSYVELVILNVLGETVEKLIAGDRPAGYHRISWSPNNVPSGIYFYRLKFASTVKTQRIIYIK